MAIISPWRSISPRNTMKRSLDDYFNSRIKNMFNYEGMDEDFNLPLMNEKSFEDKYQLEMALPGFDKDDIDVTINDNFIIIKAENSFQDDSHETYNRKEFSYQSFKQNFRIPKNALKESISASYKNGILTLDIPLKKEKIEQQSIQKIAIH